MSATRILPVVLMFITPAVFSQLQLVVPVGHRDPIYDFRFDTDRKCFITITRQGSCMIKGWDSHTGRLNYTIDELQFASFSKNAKRIIAITNKNSCVIYDGASGSILTEIPGSSYEFQSVKLSAGGKYVLAIANGDTAWAMLWNVRDKKLVRKISLGPYLNTGTVSGNLADISPDETQFCTSGWKDNAVSLWDIRSGRLLNRLRTPGNSFELKYSNTGKFLVSRLVTDDSLRIWQTNSGNLQCIIPNESLLFKTNYFSPDDKYLVTEHAFKSSEDTLAVWDVLQARLLYNINRYADGGIIYEKPVFTPNGKYLAFLASTSEYGSEVTVIETGSGLVHSRIRDSIKTIAGKLMEFFIQKFAISPDGKRILTTHLFDCIREWDLHTGKLIHDSDSIEEEMKRGSNVNWIQYSADGKSYHKIYFTNAIKHYDAQNGRMIREHFVGLRTPPVESMEFSPAPDRYFTLSRNKLIIWKRRYGDSYIEINAENKEKTARINSATFSPDGKSILITTNDGIARLWETGRPQMIWSSEKRNGSLFSGIFSPDGRYVVAIGGDSTIRFHRSNDGKFLFQLVPDSVMPRAISFSPDGEKLLVLYSAKRAFSPNLLNILEAGTWKVLASLRDTIGRINKAWFSPDNTSVAIIGAGALSIWDWVNKQTSQIGDLLLKVNSFQYTPDKKHMVWSGNDSVAVLRYPSGELTRTIFFPQASTGEMKFDSKGEEFTITSNSQVDFYNTNDFSLKYNLFLFQDDNNLIRLPSGYYKCMPEAAKKLYYMNNNRQQISFEQLDVRYNRPDKVLEALGNTDTALIRSYRRAWERRIRKLGIDTSSFSDGYSFPRCDIANRDDIKYEQKAGLIRVHLKGIDSSYKLDRFNVWVNESPLFGQKGISLRKKNSNRVDTTITIKLSQGENRVEASITNVNGTESYRMPLFVHYTPPVKQKESIRFIGIGIDKFADPKNNLEYSSKDIRDLVVKLKARYKDTILIDTLFNENVTIDNVKALKQKLLRTTVNDKVILSYSGHGVLNKEYDYYLSTYSMNFDKPEEGGLPYEELENLLDSIPARKKLMLIDACHSGEVDKEEIARYEAAEDSLSKLGTKGGGTRYTGKTQVGMKNSFELMQSLFVNVGKSTGATIISAAAGTQFALERGDLENGVFTYSILEAMDKHPTIKISELKKIVGERVEQLTNGLQKPTSRNETITVDWSLW